MRQHPGDGDGWVRCAAGHRHWGLFGAAGLLLRHGGSSLLQHRAAWTHQGDTWGLPGGARDSAEDPVQAAVREAGEEAGLDPHDVEPLGWWRTDHGGWSYTTVVAAVPPDRPRPPATAANAESTAMAWTADADVEALTLHDGVRAAWPHLRHRPARLRLVVDAANVVGARPDGWWRNRAGAAARLRDALLTVIGTGVTAGDLPAGLDAGGLHALTPAVELVLEGQARAAADRPLPDGAAAWTRRALAVRSAAGSGDDAVVAAVRSAATAPPGPQPGAPADQVLVVTADRGLRERVATAGAAATAGPGWLLERLAPPAAGR